MREFYNNYKREKAASYQNTNIYKCIEELEKYLSEYPYDYNTYPYYIHQLITVHDFTKAEEIINLIEYAFFCDSHYNDPKKRGIFTLGLLKAKIKLLMYEERYSECYKLMKENMKNFKKYSINFITPYLACKKELGHKIYNTKNGNDSHTLSLLIDYDENLFFWKMREHLDDSDMDLEDKSEARFNKSFPFEKVYRLLKTNPNYKNRLYVGYFEDTNYYRYDNCGIVDGEISNYFKAVSFHGTTNFITMYPVHSIEDMNAVSLNHIPPKKKAKIYIPDNKYEYL